MIKKLYKRTAKKKQKLGDQDMASIKDVANLAGVGLGTASGLCQEKDM